MGTITNRKISVCTLAILLFVTTSIHASEKCKSGGCRGAKSELFKYEEGTTYRYNLDGLVEISLSGSADKQPANTHITGTVLVTPLKNCEQLIRLENVHVQSPSTQKLNLGDDIKKAIRIVFHDGHIDDEICIEHGDSQNSLNVKRAVASMFQAAIKHKTEIDVFGSCPTTFTVNKEGGNTVVRKVRDLNRCAHRESIAQDFMASTFDPHSDIKGTPLLDGDYTSEQVIKNGVLQSAQVVENYLFKPFSAGNNGAKAKVTTKLQLKNKKKESPSDIANGEPRSILFENPHLVNTPSNVNNLLNALKTAEQNVKDKLVSANAARAFTALVETIRTTSRNDILTVYNTVSAGAGVHDKKVAQKILLEALNRAGTGDAVEVTVELMKIQKIPKELIPAFYVSLSFIKHATSKSLEAASQIFDFPNLPRQAYLGIGSLAGRYCREHKCDTDTNVEKLTQKFIAKLGNCKTNNRETENTYIAMLKGLGNFRRLSDTILGNLINCAKEKSVSPRVRVAALETFLADASKPKLQQAALAILKNRNEDTEIRIKAYLVLVQAPNGNIANALKDLLATEPVNQVGSFIVSHLRNVRSSANPNKELAKHHLSLLRSPKRFPIDIRRFSFNTELSYAIETLGLANSVETNVIYSQDSFVPRSTSINITSEIFGHAFNVLELGIRQENLDRLLEHYLGPRGVLETSTPSDLVESAKHETQKIANKIKQRLEKTKRGRRDVSEAVLLDFAKTIKLATIQADSALDLDLHLKFFGNELLFANINEGLQSLKAEALIDKIFDQIDIGIEKAKNFHETFGTNVQFLDMDVAYPTSNGFPLKLGVIGSGTVQLDMSTQMDLRKVLQDPKNAKASIKLVPSANIDFICTMSVDSHAVETGLQVRSSLHTATGTDVTIQMLNGKGVDVKLKLPIEKQDILTVSHDIVFVTHQLAQQANEVPLKFTGQRKDYQGCFDQLSQIIGLTFCGELKVPTIGLQPTPITNTDASPFPLSGPAKMSIRIERDDSQEYHFRGLYSDNQPDKRKLELSFDTPNSKVKRRINLEIEGGLKPEDKYIRATLTSPIKAATLEGRIINTDQEISAMAKLAYDNQEFSGKIGAKVSGNEALQMYTPLIEFKTPQRGSNDINGYKVEGAIKVEKLPNGRKLTLDNIRLIGPNTKNIIVNGMLSKDGHTYAADITVDQDKMHATAKGSVTFVSIEQIEFTGELTNNLNHNLNVRVHAQHHRHFSNEKTEAAFDNKLEITHGKDLEQSKNKILFENSAKYTIDSYKKFDISTNNKVKYDLLNILIKADGHITSHSLDYDLEGTYDKFKLHSKLKSYINKKSNGDYSIDFDTEVLDSKLKLKTSRDIVGANKSKFKNVLEIQKHKYELDADVLHEMKSNDVNFKLDAELRCSDRPNPIKILQVIVYKPQLIELKSDIKDGSKEMLNGEFKSDRAGNVNGHFKMQAEGFGDANGKITVADGKGTANCVINLIKMQRKIQGNADFQLKKPTYNLKMDLLLNADKDPSQKIHVDTQNTVTETHLQSKTKIDVLGHVLEGNIKGDLKGKFRDGLLTGEFDILFPTGHYVLGNLNRDLHIIDRVMNGKINHNFEFRNKKDEAGHKLAVTALIKDTKFNDYVYDISGTIIGTKNTGDNIEMEILAQHMPSGGDEHKYKTGLKLKGSLVKKPLELSFNNDYTSKSSKFKAHLASSNDASLNLDGSYDLGKSIPNKYAYNVKMDVKTPNEKYHTLSLTSASHISRPIKDTDSFEFNTKNALGLNEKSFSLDGTVTGTKEHGSGKMVVGLSNGTPVTISANYKRSGLEQMQITADIDAINHENKQVKLGIKLNKLNDNELKINVNAITPIKDANNVDLSIYLKRSPENNNFHTDISVTADGKKYSLVNEVEISETKPRFDLKLTRPDNKVSRVSTKYNRISSDHFSGELNIININDFSLETSGEANLQSVDDFIIKLKIHSVKLDLKDVTVEILNKPTKSGKRIQFTAKSGNTNLLSGSTSFETKEEAGQLIVQGNGDVQVKENKRTASFKFIRKNLDSRKDNEKGIEIILEGSLGAKKVLGELIVSNKQFRLREQYCEEKNNCAHIDIISRINTENIQNYNHVLEVSVDLRKFGLKHEFGLKSDYDRKELNINHIIDLYFQAQSKIAYQYKFYANPKQAGVHLTLPKRMIAIEGEIDVNVKDAPRSGSSRAQLAIYLDKKSQPDQKLLLSASSNMKSDQQKTAMFDGELRLTHPALTKDLVLSGNANINKDTRSAEFTADIDIFATKQQKFVVHGKISASPVDKERGFTAKSDLTIESKGQNIKLTIAENAQVSLDGIEFTHRYEYHDATHKREFDYKLIANKQKFEILAKSPYTTEPFHIDAKLQIDKSKFVMDAIINLNGLKKMEKHLEIKDFSSILYTEVDHLQSNDQLNVKAGITPGQIAEFRADLMKGGAKHELIHATLFLDDANFFKTDYGVNSDNIKLYFEYARKDLETVFNELKKVIDQIQNDVSIEIEHSKELLKTMTPNFQPLIDQYKQQLKQIREDLVSDETLKDIADFFKNTFGAAAAAIGDILARVIAISETIIKQLHENVGKVVEVVNKSVLPQLKQIFANMTELITEVVKKVSDIIFLVIAKVVHELKKHEEDLRKLFTSMSVVGQDLARTLAKSLNQIRIEFIKFVNTVVEQIKALPVTEVISEKYKELFGDFNLPENIVAVLTEMVQTLKSVLPTNELQEFVQVTFDYLVKKLRQEQVDDAESLKHIYANFQKALQSIFQQLQATGTTETLQNFLGQQMPLSFGSFARIPAMISVRLSPLRYLLADDLPSLGEILYTYRPRLNPLDMIPPFKLHALLVDGQHIFTFDQRHITFPGKCDYVLARDVLDANFTVVANIANGDLKYIELLDKSGSLTLKKDGSLLLNGKPTEYPVVSDSLQAWRRYYSINLKSSSGIWIKASPDLKIVFFEVNGFYRNRLRGILGNPNEESYDDFIMPNGNIAKTENELINGYKLGKECPNIKTVDHSANNHNSPDCIGVFGGDSSLRHCFPVINPYNFKQACEHALADGKKDALKDLAAAYTYACNDAGIPAKLPSSFVTCDLGNGKKLKMGETATVESPKGKADVLILIEQLKVNEPLLAELVVPAVQHIHNELKSRGITDVHFTLSGYGDGKWPAHYTNNGKILYEGKSVNMRFVDPPERKYVSVNNEKVDRVLAKLQDLAELVRKDLGLTPAHVAAFELTEYPFRPAASRSVIVIQAQNCYAHRLPIGISSLLEYLMQQKYKWNGVTFNLVTPLESMKVDTKDQKLAKSVIGFNSKSAFTFTDAKKKSIDGNTKLRDEINYDDDSCISFAENSNGAVFSSNMFKSKANQQKQYLQVFAKVIADQLSHHIVHECACGLTGSVIPRAYCVATNTKVDTV